MRALLGLTPHPYPPTPTPGLPALCRGQGGPWGASPGRRHAPAIDPGDAAGAEQLPEAGAWLERAVGWLCQLEPAYMAPAGAPSALPACHAGGILAHMAGFEYTGNCARKFAMLRSPIHPPTHPCRTPSSVCNRFCAAASTRILSALPCWPSMTSRSAYACWGRVNLR